MSEFLTNRIVKVVFDTAGTDSAGVANTTAAAHPSGVFVSDNAIITRAFYEVNTTFTSATDSATIAIMVEGAGDVVAALAISDGTNIWDAGLHGTIVGSPTLGADASHDTAIEVGALTAASFIKVAGQEEVTFTVGTDVLTAGKLTLYLEYVIGL